MLAGALVGFFVGRLVVHVNQLKKSNASLVEANKDLNERLEKLEKEAKEAREYYGP